MNEFRWHDLRVNPDDLPENGSEVLACLQYGTHIVFDYWDGFNAYEHVQDQKVHEVIAWTYIQKFDRFEVNANG